MSEKKSWGSTVIGWFVVPNEQQPATGYEQLEEPAADIPVMEEPPAVFRTEPPRAAGGAVDFDGVFDAAGVDAEERARVARASELLKSLPEGTDPALKKQIVEASLKAFGVPIEQIIEASVEEMQALEAYIRTGASSTQKLIDESDLLIREYEEKIREVRQLMQTRVEEQQTVIRSCNDKKLEIQRVLEFFGQDAVARVVRESPKLHEPHAPSQS